MTRTDHASQVKVTQTGEPRSPLRSIQLSNARAARWLGQLDRMLAEDDNGFACLEPLRNRLEDACWLARWKREEVIVEICSSVLAELVEKLLQLSHTDPVQEHAGTLEEIVRVLSACDDH